MDAGSRRTAWWKAKSPASFSPGNLRLFPGFSGIYRDLVGTQWNQEPARQSRRRTRRKPAFRQGRNARNRPAGCKDILSGFRVFSRQFVKSFPALSNGFEIETELTVHALSLKLPVLEVDTPYRERAGGSSSNLRPAGRTSGICVTNGAFLEHDRRDWRTG